MTTFALWFAGILGILWFFNRRKVNKWLFLRFAPKELPARWSALATRKDVENLADKTADAVIKKLLETATKKMEAHYEKTMLLLRARIVTLREEIEGLQRRLAAEASKPTTFVVELRGFRLNEEDKNRYFALVELAYGTLRAPFDKAQRRIVSYTQETLDHPTHKPAVFHLAINDLGAPWYGRVSGDPRSISMLGETYTLRN